ncbi:hypothetical protein [Rhizobium yanglingense]
MLKIGTDPFRHNAHGTRRCGLLWSDRFVFLSGIMEVILATIEVAVMKVIAAILLKSMRVYGFQKIKG